MVGLVRSEKASIPGGSFRTVGTFLRPTPFPGAAAVEGGFRGSWPLGPGLTPSLRKRLPNTMGASERSSRWFSGFSVSQLHDSVWLSLPLSKYVCE